MQDAVTALTSAIDELRRAREALPGELAGEVEAVLARAESLLETIRSRA